jgi:hypothetical protein
VATLGRPTGVAADASDPVPGRRTRPLSSRERVLVVLESCIAACGLAGGAWLVTHPFTALALDFLDGTWFTSWRGPGIALAFFVGVCPLLAVAATLARRRIAVTGHLCVGVGLIAWIVLEAAWVVVSPGLQLAVGATGVAILVLGVSERTARRRSRTAQATG